MLLSLLAVGVAGTALVALAGVLIYPDLPSLEALTDYRPKIPLRVYSADGFLLGEFGEERRALIKIGNVPKPMKDAILAIEDRRFYQHGGIDSIGVLRAIFSNLTSGDAREGASTITMQVARNFFLSSEKTFKRKVSEALLAMKIEDNLSKDQIFELYINQIYLGQRSYGFSAASQVYFGKPLDKLNLAEMAMLAGLPKAPSRYNPFSNLPRAMSRQQEVLRHMRNFNFIDEITYQEALKQPLRLKASRQSRDLAADYAAEIVRQNLYDRYQESIYSSGFKVYTTLRKANQEAANQAVLQGLLEYDRRHGYRGPEDTIRLDRAPEQAEDKFMRDTLADVEEFMGLEPAIVLQASPTAIKAYRKHGEVIEISGDGLLLAQKILSDKAPSKLKPQRGSLIRVIKDGGNWQLAQLPQVEAALIAVDPQNGAVRALVGGGDFNRNKFNHVTQAWRQPGSSFKPFIYSAALEKGFTPASVIEDAPLTVSAQENGSGKDWEPHNFDNKYEGPMRMRTALTKSKNMVSIRLLRAIGVNYAQDYITRFGFAAKDHPAYLTMALGAGSVTAWQMAGAYSTFANGGFRVTPYLIDRIVDGSGKLIEQAKPLAANAGASRVIDPRNAYLMTSMMQDVVRIGTAARARQLGRSDLAGKTGTTNNHMDAWFAGFSPAQVAVAWIGFDQPRPLGGRETGGTAALPIWIHYMSSALQGLPDQPYVTPQGVVSIKINPATGERASEAQGGLYEVFFQEFPPLGTGAEPVTETSTESDAKAGQAAEPEQLF